MWERMKNHLSVFIASVRIQVSCTARYEWNSKHRWSAQLFLMINSFFFFIFLDYVCVLFFYMIAWAFALPSLHIMKKNVERKKIGFVFFRWCARVLVMFYSRFLLHFLVLKTWYSNILMSSWRTYASNQTHKKKYTNTWDIFEFPFRISIFFFLNSKIEEWHEDEIKRHLYEFHTKSTSSLSRCFHLKSIWLNELSLSYKKSFIIRFQHLLLAFPIIHFWWL